MAKLPNTMPANNLIALCTLNLNTYTVTFKVNGEVYHTEQVKYTFPIPYPENPNVEGYNFKGWDSSLSDMPMNDVEINAIFEKIAMTKTATINVDDPTDTYQAFEIEFESGMTWAQFIASDYNVDGKFYYSGGSIRYLRNSWTVINYPEGTGSPTNSTVITENGQYLIQIKYLVRWYTRDQYNNNGEIGYTDYVKLSTMNYYRPNSTILGGNDPSSKTGYTFSGWDEVGTVVMDDMDIHGTYNLNTYTATFKVNGQVYHTAQVKYTFPITYPETPTVDGYTFKGWDSTISEMPANDAEINAVLNKNKISFTIEVFKSSGMIDTTDTFNCDYGTTWGELIANAGGTFIINPTYSLQVSGDDVIVTKSDKAGPLFDSAYVMNTVAKNDVIVANKSYYVDPTRVI